MKMSLKRKLTSTAIAAMVALTAVMPAFAQTVNLQVSSYGYYYDNTYVDGSRVKVTVRNTGESPFGHPDSISYTLYDYNSDLIKQGKVFPAQRLWEGDQWGWVDVYEAEFETTSGGFNLDLWCDGYMSYCEGSATVEVLD